MGLGVPGQGPSARWDGVCGAARGQDANVPVGTSMFPRGSFAVGRLPATRQGGWGSSCPQSQADKIYQTPSAPAADPGEALSLLAAQRRCFGKHTREVREMALLWETFPGQVEEGTGWFLEERRLCQYHGKGRAGQGGKPMPWQ